MTQQDYQMRKPVVLQKYRKSNQFQKLTTISFFFSFFIFESSARKNDIVDAGEQIMLSITDARKKEKTMDQQHLADCYKKHGEKSFDKPESPVPTPDATAKHSEKVIKKIIKKSYCSKLVRK